MAESDALRRATRGLPSLRLRLGALAARAASPGLAATFGLSLAVAAVFAWVSIQRWRWFETNAYDLAFFDQIIFNTSRGRWFETSFLEYNFTGQHMEPVLLAFVPLYWLGAGPETLVLVQVFVAVAAAVPLFLFAKRLGLTDGLAFALSAGYLLNPFLHRALIFDFHPEVMVGAPAFCAAWAVAAGRTRLAVAATIATLLFKEDAAFVALALCGLMAAHGSRRAAAAAAGVTALYVVATVFVLMPALRGGHEGDLPARYGHIISLASPGAFLASLPRVPTGVAGQLADPVILAAIASFLLASALAALARPAMAVWLIPGLLLAVLSSHEPQSRLELHYAAQLVALGAVASAAALPRLAKRLDPLLLGLLLVGPPLIVGALLNPLGAAHGQAPSAEHREAVLTALSLVPGAENVSLSAQSGLLPRLSQRREAYEFPERSERVDWVVVDRYGFRSKQSLAAGFEARLEDVRREMELVYANDGVEVFRRSR